MIFSTIVICILLASIVGLIQVNKRQYATINRLTNSISKHATPAWVVHQIRTRYISGADISDLAVRYKVTRPTVVRCVKYWTHKKVSPDLRPACLALASNIR